MRQSPKLLDQVVAKCRDLNYSEKSVSAFKACCYEFLCFHKQGDQFIHPEKLGRAEVECYLRSVKDGKGDPGLAFDALAMLYNIVGRHGVVVDESAKLTKRLSDKIRMLGYSPKTRDTYGHWIGDFLTWSRLGRWEAVRAEHVDKLTVEEYLKQLAVKRDVSSTTQNLALQSILFMCKQLLGVELVGVDALRAKRPETLPTVLGRQEVSQLFALLSGQHKLIAMLLYGCGFRIGECLSLRLKDIDFERQQITIRAAKGKKDRVVQLPRAVEPLLLEQVAAAERWHAIDIADGKARVPLPNAFGVKSPKAASQLCWWWLFCSNVRSKDPETKEEGRWHIDESNFTRSLAIAAAKAGIKKRVYSHCLRHSYATDLLDSGTNIRAIQKLLGHNSLETTMRYTHVQRTGPASEQSPRDSLMRIAYVG